MEAYGQLEAAGATSYTRSPPARSQWPTGQGKAITTLDIGPFTKIPSKFFGSGLAARLGPSASLVYLALCEHGNRNSRNSFTASDKALSGDTTLGARTIYEARKKLSECGLITYSREPGNSYVYRLLVPSLEWKPLKERLRNKLKPRALHASRIEGV
jgi:hypothetical protein